MVGTPALHVPQIVGVIDAKRHSIALVAGRAWLFAGIGVLTSVGFTIPPRRFPPPWTVDKGPLQAG
jgi:hypothetical protein